MKALEYIGRTREYLNYLERHILNVASAWKELQNKCKDMNFIYDDFYFFTIDEQIKEHDISKFSKEEFTTYRKRFYPVEGEKCDSLGHAWEHHKHNNSHHWENWTKEKQYAPNGWMIPCVHMIVDWMAMSYEFKDTAQSYYEKNKDRIILPNYTIPFIYEIFKRIE
jgi:hypothetical protein